MRVARSYPRLVTLTERERRVTALEQAVATIGASAGAPAACKKKNRL